MMNIESRVRYGMIIKRDNFSAHPWDWFGIRLNNGEEE